MWLATFRVTGFITGGIVFFIIGFLMWESSPAIEEVGITRFFSDSGWYPASGLYNLVPMLAGSVTIALGALILSAPLGVGVALFIHFYAPGFLGIISRRLIEVLAGIPSVIYGLWGLVYVVPFIAGYRQPGQSLLAGVLMVGLMIVPTVALFSDLAIRGIPQSTFLSGRALGITQYRFIISVVLPIARPGIVAGLVLALMRAVGETIVVLMVTGNVVQLPADLFSPVRALTSTIALEMGYATVGHRSVLFSVGLVLMIAALCLTLIAARFGRNTR